jgi:hypothetical protein
MLPFDLGRVENDSNAGHLRCISGLVRTGKSDDDADIDRVLPIAARATSAELALGAQLLWLAQEMSEKNTPNVPLRRLLRKPQQMHAQFKLNAGSPRRDRHDPINIGVIVGLAGAYQARNASQMPCIRVVFDAAKVEKQHPTRTAKSDDALTKNNLVAYFRNRPIFCARSHQRPVSHICPV